MICPAPEAGTYQQKPRPSAKPADNLSLYPPRRLATELRAFLKARFPTASDCAVTGAASGIGAVVAVWYRSDRAVKIKEHRGSLRYEVIRRARTVADDLRRLERVGKAFKEGSDGYIWAKAWQEANSVTIDLLDQVAGGHEAKWQKTIRAPGILEVPHPDLILQFLPDAKLLARKSRIRTTVARDLAIAEIACQLERLSGSRLKHPRIDYSSGKRGGALIEFLNALEAFYAPHCPIRFGVKHSGSVVGRIIEAIHTK